MTEQQQLALLEDMIDNSSVSKTLALVADICAAKADHIQHAWQDEGTARVWDSVAEEVAELASNLNI